MSVVVKGMRIPENCIRCPMQFGGLCYVAPPEIDERVAPTVDEAVEQGKPEWCPLVDLGKHGNLIDRDAFKSDYGMKDDCADCEKELRGKVKACEYDRIYSKMDFCGWLDDTDVVIEAEGE